ncbi:hybrid sensor histidine kinase/response regulator [Desulfolucanica intricata]|uniref:hybrid sensor histidine kinase/response regulator n=1 Tax=Desulfolucanica intricata TaxID=1285191 RepID=UPI0008315AB9|nr:response regulator [Desulfolucanica intricata]
MTKRISENINSNLVGFPFDKDNSLKEKPEPGKLHKGKVLIVDDMLMHLETAKLYLGMSGFEVFCVSDTKSAWEFLQKEKIDLVLLDVVLPGGDGLELLTKIHLQYPNTGVIIMTAFGSEDIAAMALKLGAMDYIKKPFKYSSLGEIVEKIISKKRQINIQEIEVKTLKDAYEELQVSAESILQCMSDGVVAVDKNLCIRIMNQKAERLLNVKKQNVTGRFFYDVFPHLKNIGLLHDTLKNERGLRLYEVEIPTATGVIYLNINTDVIFDFKGNKIGAVAVFDDFTNHKHTKKILENGEGLTVNKQTSMEIEHKTNKTLATIKDFNQLLSEKSPNSAQNDYLKTIASETNQMNQIIQDLLKLDQLKPPQFKKICINEILREVIPIIDPHAFLKNIFINIKADDSIPESLMDPNQIKQVILLLIQNVMESIKNGGKLDIETMLTPQINEICLNIRGTGYKNQVEKTKNKGSLFDTPNSDKNALGLNISLNIINQHKGRIETQSKEGYEIKFSVYLPLDGY